MGGGGSRSQLEMLTLDLTLQLGSKKPPAIEAANTAASVRSLLGRPAPPIVAAAAGRRPPGPEPSFPGQNLTACRSAYLFFVADSVTIPAALSASVSDTSKENIPQGGRQDKERGGERNRFPWEGRRGTGVCVRVCGWGEE